MHTLNMRCLIAEGTFHKFGHSIRLNLQGSYKSLHFLVKRGANMGQSMIRQFLIKARSANFGHGKLTRYTVPDYHT